MSLSDADFMTAAIEQALRGRGSVAPNPAVGAVVVRDGSVVAAGYHARYGDRHAETAALDGADARGATLYVTLEPCRHQGKQPPCTDAIVRSGVARVVIGAMDPNPVTGGEGAGTLQRAGIRVDVLDDPRCTRLIEDFAVWTLNSRPYVALKMAMSLDGRILSAPGQRRQLTGEAWSHAVRELRSVHDAVMVGAGTVRVDDPMLTVRPPVPRARPYVRVVACETDTVPGGSRVFEPVDGYDATIVLAPGALRERFEPLASRAQVAFVGDAAAERLDLVEAMRVLRECGVYSVLCEGGPTLGARLIARGLVDRFYWAVAPELLCSEHAVPVLAGAELAALQPRLAFDTVERVGDDALLSGRILPDV